MLSSCHMFTGIVENQHTITHIFKEGTNTHFRFQGKLANELKVDQSVSHNGICLTVTKLMPNEQSYEVTAIQETLNKTNAALWEVGNEINIERCMPANGRFDGHMVQGHVDGMGFIDELHDLNGSRMVFISHSPKAGITVPKGSITINGVSLTVVDSFQDAFSVAIIPYTWDNTSFKNTQQGDAVNLEFDILGKYVQKIMLTKNEILPPGI